MRTVEGFMTGLNVYIWMPLEHRFKAKNKPDLHALLERGDE